MTRFQRPLEQSSEDWGKGVMAMLEDSSGNLALAY